MIQADKVVQLYETMMTRHTTMVVGPTGGGKSVIINTLAQAQTKCVYGRLIYTGAQKSGDTQTCDHNSVRS